LAWFGLLYLSCLSLLYLSCMGLYVACLGLLNIDMGRLGLLAQGLTPLVGKYTRYKERTFGA